MFCQSLNGYRDERHVAVQLPRFVQYDSEHSCAITDNLSLLVLSQRLWGASIQKYLHDRCKEKIAFYFIYLQQTFPFKLWDSSMVSSCSIRLNGLLLSSEIFEVKINFFFLFSALFDVYRKFTFTGQFLNFNSHHPYIM